MFTTQIIKSLNKVRQYFRSKLQGEDNTKKYLFVFKLFALKRLTLLSQTRVRFLVWHATEGDRRHQILVWHGTEGDRRHQIFTFHISNAQATYTK